jgi:phosphoglycolate phosphatase
LSDAKLAVDLLAIDLDGTLVDSAPDIAHCLGSALEAVGFEAPGEARTRVWIGDGLETLISRSLAHAERSASRAPAEGLRAEERQAAVLRAFLDCYRDNLFVRSRLYPGAAETLDALRTRGLTLCCITNKRLSFSESLLTQAGVRDRFALVLGGDSLPEKKPSPMPLLAAAETLGVSTSSAALVGDSHQDLRAARSAGYAFILATYGYGKVDETEAATAPRIRRFTDLRALLGAG